MSFLIIVPLSIAGGIVAAMYRGKLVDRILTVGGLSAAVIPEFVWAVTLILLFGVTLEVLPVTAFPTRGDPSFFSQIEHLILPSIALLLVWEHSLVKPDDLSRVNQAFFTANAVIGLVLLAAIAADLWL
jgi:peptide/nickel transport system permease protein